jgi:prepilin-type processing-associated H-X9-DG protein
MPGSQGSFGTDVNNPWFGYAMNRLENGLAGRTYPRSLSALPGQVIFLSESENNQFSFTDGFFIGPNNPTPVPPRHSGGMNFVFVDGHAQWYALADYGRPSPMSAPSSAQIEWAQPHALYWFPCRTCNKN